MRKIFSALCALILLSSLLTPAAAATPDIAAQAAVIIDFDSGDVLFERDAHTMRVPASMTKILTCFIAYEEIAAGRLSMETMVEISANTARVTNNRLLQQADVPMVAGTFYSVEALIYLAMLPSSGGACVALAEHISGTEEAFAELMNETGRRLGMELEFTNSHGSIPHYTTVYSMGILVREFILRHPDIIRISSATSYTYGGQTWDNTNQLLQGGVNYYHEADGFKTGTIRESGFCLASTAVRDGRRVIVVVMNTANNIERYGDSRTLLDFAFAELARRDAVSGARVGTGIDPSTDAAASAQAISVFLDSEPVFFDADPQLINSRVMVPVRAVFEAFGASVEWNAGTGHIIALTDDGVVELTVGSRTIAVNGIVSEIDAPPIIIGYHTLVPLRFIAEALGAEVEWVGATRTVEINTP